MKPLNVAYIGFYKSNTKYSKYDKTNYLGGQFTFLPTVIYIEHVVAVDLIFDTR